MDHIEYYLVTYPLILSKFYSLPLLLYLDSRNSFLVRFAAIQIFLCIFVRCELKQIEI